MKRSGFLLILLISLLITIPAVHAQSDGPLVLVMTADGPIMPPMLEYIKRGIHAAEERKAEMLVIQLDTFGGSIDTMKSIVQVSASRMSCIVGLAVPDIDESRNPNLVATPWPSKRRLVCNSLHTVAILPSFVDPAWRRPRSVMP